MTERPRPDIFPSWKHRLAWRIARWCRSRFAVRAPNRLVDPEGEGIYYRDCSISSQLRAAYEMNVTDDRGRIDIRALRYEIRWMRERDGEWFPVSFRHRDLFKLPRWRPVEYLYVTPPAEPTIESDSK